MNDQQPSESSPGLFVQILRNATPFEMGLVAFIVFPAIFFAWNPILKELLPSQASLRIAILLVGYVMLVGLMLYGKVVAEQIKKSEKARKLKVRERKQKLEIAKDTIHSRMLAHKITRSSYERLRQHLDRDEIEWSNDFLDEMVAAYPALFRYQKIKGGKPGLSVLNSVEVNED